MRLNTLVLGVILVACGPSVSSNDPDGGNNNGGDGGGTTCTDGARYCSGNVLQQCSNNEYVTLETCSDACDPVLGCVLCQPGTGTCSGDVSNACRADGQGYEEVYCDPVQGMSCDAQSGRCVGACSPDSLGSSYIGCDYYPTVTAQIVGTMFPYGVVIANTSNVPATITIDGGGMAARTFDVPGNSVRREELPWVMGLKVCADTTTANCSPGFGATHVPGGAYHLRSTQPVTVYQFSPFDYTRNGSFTYSNDASLLLPTNVLTGNYVVAAWPFWSSFSFPGILAVTAVEDNTTVTVTTRANVAGNGGQPTFNAGTPTSTTLNRGDVLQLLNPAGDLTGSVVAADKRVQVIGGHHCTNVPLNITACDHLEESMFPVETLSKEYLITAPAVPTLPNGKEEVIRVIATAPNTTFTIDPPIGNVTTTLANIGDFVEIARQTGDYLISADQKILVAQYMEGQQAGGGTGDPAMTLAVAVDQYRRNYLFHAPTNYEVNYVNITAPNGAVVMLDGVQVEGFTAIGSSGYGVARVQLTNGPAGDGNHNASSSEPFGISVYGYGQYTSFWYPGGLDLTTIPID